MMLYVEDTVDAPGGDPAHTHVHSQGELTCESYGDASLHARGMAAIESARHRLDDVLPPAVRKGVRVVPAVLVERDHGRADHNQHGLRSPGEPHGRGRFKEGDDVLPLVGERAFNPSLLLVLLFRAAQVAQVAQHPVWGAEGRVTVGDAAVIFSPQVARALCSRCGPGNRVDNMVVSDSFSLQLALKSNTHRSTLAASAWTYEGGLRVGGGSGLWASTPPTTPKRCAARPGRVAGGGDAGARAMGGANGARVAVFDER